MRVRLRRARAVASAAVALFAAAIVACPTAAHADVTSTVGWVRLAQLSPQMADVDVYLSPTSGSSGQPVLPHAAYGTFSQYQAVAPGDYSVAMRTAGAPATTDPVAGAQLTVAAGQSYTVASLGTGSVTKLSVQNDATNPAPGRAQVRVIEASQRYPLATVAIGTNTLAANLHAPTVAPYTPVAPGVSALLVTTGAVTQTIAANLAANSTYSVVVLDGTQGAARVLVLTDAAGISTLPKGGVNTGFGGTAPTGHVGEVHRQGYAAPLAESLAVLAMLAGIAITSIRRRRRRQARLAAHLEEVMRHSDEAYLYAEDAPHMTSAAMHGTSTHGTASHRTARMRDAGWADFE